MASSRQSRPDTFTFIDTPLSEARSLVVIERFTKSGHQDTTLMQNILASKDIFEFVTFSKVVTELADSQGVLLRLCYMFDCIRDNHLAKLLRLVEEPRVVEVLYQWASLALPATQMDMQLLNMLIRDRSLSQEIRDSLSNCRKKFDCYV